MIFGSVLAAGLLTISPDAKADTAVQCVGCTPQQMQLKLFQFVNSLPVPSRGEVYFINTSNDLVRKWSYNKYYQQGMCDPRMGPATGCLADVDTRELPVEAAVQTYVELVRAYNGQREHLTYDPILGFPPGAYPQDGYDLMQHPTKQDLVGKFLRETQYGLVQDLRNLVAMVTPLGWFTPQFLNMRIVAVTADGSTHVYVYNPQLDRFEFQPKESKDPKGNRIPETTADVAGTPGSVIVYDFTNAPETLIDFLARMEALGIPVTGPIGDVEETKLACSSRIEGDRTIVQCVRI